MIEYENLQLLNRPLEKAYDEALLRVRQSGWYVTGKENEEFCSAYAEYCGTKYAVGVGNGLDALVLCLRALDLPIGSEVIVPSNTYIATILAVVQCGHSPILVEPDETTCNLDPALLEAAISPKTRAILPVHLYGKLCDMHAIMKIANQHELYVIEDCAQAHGASQGGKRAGSWGHLNAHSFYPTKNLGALGDAGAVTGDDSVLVERVRCLRNYGSTIKYQNELIGVNSRLDELQAAFLKAKLARLDEITAHKRTLADVYHDKLPDSVIKPSRAVSFFDVHHIYNIRVKQRDALRQKLGDRGIKTEVHYPIPPHKQVAMKGILSGSYPISERIHETTLSLPISWFHTKQQVEEVCMAIKELSV